MTTAPLQFLDVTVASKRPVATDVYHFELSSRPGCELPSFTAGAHVDVQLPGGLVRQYSLCGDPADRRHYRLAVLKERVSRGGSEAMHARVAEGDSLRISAPRNNFALEESAARSILIAGGIGITPILSMAYRLASLDRAFELHYCARSLESAAFHAELRACQFQDRVSFHFDDATGKPTFPIGRHLNTPADDVHVYVCGPAGLIVAVKATASESGWPARTVHSEFFVAPAQNADDNRPFLIRTARSNRCLLVPPDRSALDVLLESGVHVQASCEQGVCGTCLTKILDGIPDHRDVFQTDEEKGSNRFFTPCCSRAKTDLLALDL